LTKNNIVKIPLRLLDWRKVKKTGRGYTRRELSAIKFLLKADHKSPVRSFLNVGFHDYQDRRNRWWIDLCRANSIDWHILELFPANKDNFLRYAPPEDHHRITLGDIRDVATLYTQKFDVIFHWHGPEHLKKDDYLALLPDLIATADNLLLLGCPNGHEEQGMAYGNPHEEHISFWTPEEFHKLGFVTDIVSDKSPGHLSAAKFLNP
jgi:hypothetical protein